MKEIEKLTKLLEAKKDKLYSEEDKEKYEIIQSFLNNDEYFFKANAKTVLGMLEFLEVDEKEAIDLYFNLISPENYQKKIPSERIAIDPKKL